MRYLRYGMNPTLGFVLVSQTYITDKGGVELEDE